MSGVATDVLKEASNLATPRSEGEKLPEYHSSHVNDAFEMVAERGLRRRVRSKLYLTGRIVQMVLVLALVVTGTNVSAAGAEAFWSYAFTVNVAVTLVIQLVLEIADWSGSK